MRNYSRMIRYTHGHYDVLDEFGDFVESCDTYEEAQAAVDEYLNITAA